MVMIKFIIVVTKIGNYLCTFGSNNYMLLNKNILKVLLTLITCMFFLNVKCPQTYNYNYTAYKPVFMDRADLEKSIKLKDSVNLVNPAKIYIINNYIFISEAYKGVHIFDNTNPKNPVKKVFIRIVGCLDMAIKNNTLYVDNATDLVTIDISNPLDPKEISRIKNAFPEPTPPDMRIIPDEFSLENRPGSLILVEWIKK